MYFLRLVHFETWVLTGRAGLRARAAGGAGPRRGSPGVRRRRTRSPPRRRGRRRCRCCRRPLPPAAPAPRSAPARAACFTCRAALRLCRANGAREFAPRASASALIPHCTRSPLQRHWLSLGAIRRRSARGDSLDIGARGAAGEGRRSAKRRANRVRAARGLPPPPPRVVVALPRAAAGAAMSVASSYLSSFHLRPLATSLATTLAFFFVISMYFIYLMSYRRSAQIALLLLLIRQYHHKTRCNGNARKKEKIS